MSIIIGADIVPLKTNIDLFEHAQIEELIGEELQYILKKADYRIFNLEVPLTNIERPINKMGPNFVAPTACVTGLRAIGIDLLTLANNHIMDQDEQGLFSTIDVLDNNYISHIGAGNNIYEARRAHIVKINGKNIGIYACTEHEFSIADDNKPGANPFDPLFSLDHIYDLKKNVDYLIVLYHGGKEYYRYPSPYLQKVCRRMVDKGANLVVCQHSHCIGCEEKYKHGIIVYGQGNFLFDGKDDEYWKTSLLISIGLDGNITYIPIIKVGNCIRLAKENQAEDILNDFFERSMKIKAEGFLKKNYAELSYSLLPNYLRALNGKQPLIRRILNRLTDGRIIRNHLKKVYPSRNCTQIANYIDCEAHRELLSTGLKNLE